MVRRVLFPLVLALVLAGLLFAPRSWFASAWAGGTPVAASSAKAAPFPGFPAQFRHSLFVLDHGAPQELDTAKLAGVKYWAFYYSAAWCPPCALFTPDLVRFYRDFKPYHPDFELIFVSQDLSEKDMLDYMKNDAMPWPSVRFADIHNPEIGAMKYFGLGPPCLVFVAADGHVLADTFNHGEFTDPHHVIDAIRATVKD